MRQKLGQHFLVTPEVSKAIAAALEPESGDRIIEIGPGHGELTAEIVSSIESSGAKDVRLMAIEKDPVLAEGTRARFKDKPWVEVLEGDVLEVLKDDGGRSLFHGKYKLAGNLPYYLTGHLLRLIEETPQRPQIAVFMVQKEVAERMTSLPPQMNKLSAAVGFWSEPQVLFEVPKESFDPPPEVDSAVVFLRTRAIPLYKDSETYYETVRAIFAQPRKTLLNNLKSYLASRGSSAQNPSEVLEAAGITPSMRPQDLSLEKIAGLAEHISRL